ncbi:electrogenic sodium bicarbonate cotransporter 1-like [Mizuhopecten yessoensis]|uniref:Anion exchange protein n=1 Tax=Mizuhopecten yessoensis TaxID=6573 RepID=A0A210QHB8_MIZYE|nr:electrogenic sodium bicarbonate cotransporter 1-like [Mizuhopecten yessoensis]OWF48132.1 Sodium-driven chloride bicarbonate exchanger [Mizuhopecten yessoensis]
MNNNTLVADMVTTKGLEGDDARDDESEDGEREPRDIFCQMGILRHYDEELVWKEIRRWVKFEEVLEEKGKRWSKPHVSSLYMQSLTELQLLLASNPIFLDLDANNMFDLTETLVAQWTKDGYLESILTNHVRALLLKRHKHHHVHLKHMTRNTQSKLHLILYGSGSEDDSAPSTPDLRGLDNEGMRSSLPDLTQVDDTLPTNENSMSCPDHLYQQVNTPKINHLHHHHAHLMHHHGHGPPNRKFLRKIPVGAEVLNILVGEVDALDTRLAAFVRLKNAKDFGHITEVALPTRFLFIMLVPKNAFESSSEIGRCMGTLMTDPFFRETAYMCDDRVDIMTAVQEFASQVTVLPPGSWDPKTRIEPPDIIPSKESRKKEVVPIDMPDQPEEAHHDDGLDRTGRLFGGLINDIKRKIKWYKSDFTDALHLQCVASFFYLFLATLTPNVTFGGLLGEATHQYMGTMECILAAAVSGVSFALFSGQPLNILGSTGPMLILEMILYNLCSDNGWDFMPARVWVGVWTAFFLLIIVAFDLSSLVQYITRFTEDSFACLVALIFIYEAVAKLLEIREDDPIELHPLPRVDTGCVCFFGNVTTDSSSVIPRSDALANLTTSVKSIASHTVSGAAAAFVNSSNSTVHPLVENATTWMEHCTLQGGIIQGSGCDVTKYVPDVFLFSLMLFLGTTCLAFCFVKFRDSLFCPTVVRQTVSDFSVLLAIVIMVGLDFGLGLPTPKLTVPTEFKPTREGRGWFINPISDTNPWWLMLASALPAILATILVFMDQQITSVIVNRTQHKLKKGAGYHLDLLVVAVLIVILSLLGLPWYVAATVTAIAHVMSLKKTSECTAPGEKPTFLGVREQRVTSLLVGIFSGLAVLITSILKYIPMPVLYGVFFYMGVSALNGMQLVERIMIVFMPQKYQPDYKYLRYVPLPRVHLFTFIQVVCLAVLWIVKSVKSIAISFPIMVVAICFVRKALEYVFDQYELQWLDSLLPEMCKSAKITAEEATPTVIATRIKFARSLSVPASTPTTGSTAVDMKPDGHQHSCASRKISTGSSQASTVYGHHVCRRKISILSLPVNPTFVLDHGELQRVREDRSVNFSLDNLNET